MGRHSPALAFGPETARHGLVPVNTQGEPIVATATFMAKGIDTWSMKLRGSEPGATGTGLVQWTDTDGRVTLVVPPVAAVAVTMGVPRGLITLILSHYEEGQCLHTLGLTEADYRRGLGNSMSVMELVKFLRRNGTEPATSTAPVCMDTGGGGCARDDRAVRFEEHVAQQDDSCSMSPSSDDSDGGQDVGEPAGPSAVDVEGGGDTPRAPGGTPARREVNDYDKTKSFTWEEAPGSALVPPPKVAWGWTDEDQEERSLMEHPDDIDLLDLGEDLLELPNLPAGAPRAEPAVRGEEALTFREAGTPYNERRERARPKSAFLDPEAPGPPCDAKIVAEVDRIVSALKAAQDNPGLATLGADWSIEQTNQHLRELMDQALDGKHFKALRYQEHIAAWRALFSAMQRLGFQKNELTKPQARILKILGQGYFLQFQPLHNMFTDGRPRARHKFAAARRLVRNTVGEQRADLFMRMDAERPPPLHFGNHRSCEDNKIFVREARDEFLRSGAMRRWYDLPFAVHRGRPPRVVNPLSVAFSAARNKYRLCYDMRYVNCWLRYHGFRFETIEELLALIKIMEAQHDVYICLSDMKSGYHHIPVHPDCWTYCAVVIDGEYYYFPAMSFGMSSAVEVYCAVEGEKHRCLRHLGLRLVQYIDDRASPYSSIGSALFHESLIVQLVSALGGFLSFGDVSYDEIGRILFSKMQLYPLRCGIFLGFMIDILNKRVSIPEKKLKYFIGVCEQLLSQDVTSSREKAQFAGLVVSFMKAVVPARLYVRQMFRALTGVISWDKAYSTPAEERAVILRFRNGIRQWNGRLWVRSPTGFVLCGDASINLGAAYEVTDYAEEPALAATTHAAAPEEFDPGPGLRPQGYSGPRLAVAKTISDGGRLKHTITVHIDPEVAARGSTVREAHVCRKSVQVVLEQHGEELRGSTIVYIGDNLGMSQVLENWWAHDEHLCRELELLYDSLMGYGVDFRSDWERRTTARMIKSDRLGKTDAVDNSAWELCETETERIIKMYCRFTRTKLHPHGRRPTIDGMADPTNTKAPLWISRELTPGGAGANFFDHLGLMAGPAGDGEPKHLVWLNGDFGRMSDILAAIWEYRLDVILIFPIWPASWRDMVDLMPHVKGWGPNLMPNRPRLFKAGPQVTTEDLGAIRYRVASRLILWPAGDAGRRDQ